MLQKGNQNMRMDLWENMGKEDKIYICKLANQSDNLDKVLVFDWR